MIRRSFIILAIVGFWISLALSTNAQVNPNLDEIGLKPYGSFEGGNFDSISLANGDLNLHIPWLSYPQRGSLSGNSYFRYTGKNWFVFQHCNNGVCTSQWKYDYHSTHGVQGISDSPPNVTYKQLVPGSPTWVYTAKTSDGSSHLMMPNNSGGYESVDASGIWYNGYNPLSNPIPYPITIERWGRKLANFGTSTTQEDPNGNLFTYTNSIIDTMNRPTGTSTTTTDYSGCIQPASPNTINAASISTLPGQSGSSLMLKSCGATYSLRTDFQATDQNGDPVQEGTMSTSFLVSVVLYNGTSWSSSPAWGFDYAGPGGTVNYGDLTKITLPTGGTISYGWGTLSMCAAVMAPTLVSRVVVTRTVDPQDGSGPKTWTYHSGAGVDITIDPGGNETSHTMTDLGGCAVYETQTQWFQGSHTSGTLLKTEKTDFTSLASPYPGYLDPATRVNVVPIRVTTTWPNGKVTKIEKDYDSNFIGGSVHYSYGDVLAVREYDYGSGTAGTLLRTTTNTYKAFATSSYLTANLLDLVLTSTVTDTSGQVAKTTYGYDEYNLQPGGITVQRDSALNTTAPGTRGNRTSSCRWLNTTGGNLCTYNHYYDTGMTYQVTDPAGNTTSYSYSSTYAGAYLTQTNMPTTGTIQHIVSGTYDFNTGQLMSFTDQNNKTSNFTYDALRRILTGSFPDGGLTTFTYTDTPLSAHVERTQKIDSSRSTDFFVYFDGLARKSRTFSFNEQQTPWDQIDTCYDLRGNVGFTSYPYQGTGSGSSKICSGVGNSFVYDALNRVSSVTHSDGSVVSSAYTGPATKVTDEGNGTRSLQRVSQVDGVGRLKSVCEVSSITLVVGLNPIPAACGQDIAATGFLTSYTYDAANNLKTVAQGSLTQRTFNYDSLSRVTSAFNPESGTVTYKYDSDTNCAAPNSFLGQLVSKTDARGIRACTGYDALSRIVGKSYSDGTPGLYFYYDVAPGWQTDLTNVVGRLANTNNSHSGSTDGLAAAATFSYDAMGRVIRHWQQTPSASPGGFPLYYSYDLAGDMTSSTNGAAVTLSYNYNRANRLTSLTSSLTGPAFPGTLLSAVTYNAFGAPLNDTLGASAKTEARTYTPRGWLQTLNTLQGTTQRYNFGLTFAPDGNILTGNDSSNGNWTYAYDDFNRLLSANATGQAYTYDYDRFGNRWHQNGPHTSSLGFDANNRIVAGSGVTYDAAGNVTADGVHTYTFDAENRITAVDAGATARYVYDVNGQRIRKTTGGVSVDYLYDLSGHAITELSATLTWNRGEVYAGGRHVATYSGGTSGTTYFVHSDWLGTERARVTYSGAPYESCTSLPFGDWQSCTGTDPSPMHFTGKERDTESGLDNFGARYCISTMGRFMSPDAMTISIRHLQIPQKFNQYTYVLNNPLAYIDPDGLQEFTITVSRFISAPVALPGALGDNRKAGQAGTFRIQQKIIIETDKSKNEGNAQVSASHAAGSSIGVNTNGNFPITPIGIGASDTSKLTEAASRDAKGNVTANFSADAKYPNTPAELTPSITQNLSVTATPGPNGSTTFSVSGTYSTYPGLEITAQPTGSNDATLLYGDNANSITKTILGATTLLCPDSICAKTIPKDQPSTTVPAPK